MAKRKRSRIPGIIRPNLVITHDNEKGWEFRVQCEVLFKKYPKDARQVSDILTGRVKGDPGEAKRLVERNINDAATTVFREIVSKGFDANIDGGGGRGKAARKK